MSNAVSSSMRRDIASAYGVTAARIGSWVVVSAMVYRWIGPDYFGYLALIRATLAILNYTTLGIAPAMIHIFAQAQKPIPVLTIADSITNASKPIPLDYASPSTRNDHELGSIQILHASGFVISLVILTLGIVISVIYGWNITRFNNLNFQENIYKYAIVELAMMWGFGCTLRLASDAFGAVLQSRDRISLDNSFLIIGEILWVCICWWYLLAYECRGTNIFFFKKVGTAYIFSGIIVFILRGVGAGVVSGSIIPRLTLVKWKIITSLLSFGILVVLAQMADFLYAPVDYNLINWFLPDGDLVAYAPAVQIDGGMLLLVGALATVLLPKAAIAHAAGDVQRIRHYYVRGTLASAGILLLAGVAVFFASPWIFKLWLGDSMKTTQVILPLVLIHTIIGGSSAVGRSILLGMGKVKAFTIAVLVAGATNVLLSFIFVYYLHWGLRGIILGTIVAVVGRCGIWMPWYTLRMLRRSQEIRNPNIEIRNKFE